MSSLTTNPTFGKKVKRNWSKSMQQAATCSKARSMTPHLPLFIHTHTHTQTLPHLRCRAHIYDHKENKWLNSGGNNLKTEIIPLNENKLNKSYKLTTWPLKLHLLTCQCNKNSVSRTLLRYTSTCTSEKPPHLRGFSKFSCFHPQFSLQYLGFAQSWGSWNNS